MTEPPSTERSIFLEAIEIVSARERAAYLDQACKNHPELRHNVEALLLAHAQPQRILDAPLAAMPTLAEPPPREAPGTRIGPYRLMEQLGEGGMGLVFVAAQEEPICRKVALKLIKPGMDSKQVVARFEAERQALALMDHPNIARVFDGGTTESGRPYFVMELVKGVPITDFCDQLRLTPRQRLELFVTVCQAVQHAHTKGIIHRDLKPSNVLVTLHDTAAVPKVIDFGVAKAVGQQLTDKTVYTHLAQMVGTPLYMSPEQAGLCGQDVDTRSDVYSLGVLLYELLTGTTPLGREALKQVGYDELRRIIREDEPLRPSARLSTLQAQALSTVAEHRGVEPRKLNRQLRGELDWIVMKALEKDRSRRYETANGFAMDVQRYLADEPVVAGPPSRWYRLRKFARRNKVILSIASVVVTALVLLVAGLAVSNGMIRREQGRTEAAWQAEAKQRQEALANYRAAEEQRRLAQQAVEDFFTTVSESDLLNVPGLQPLRKQLLDSALKYYQDFIAQQGQNPAIQHELSAAYFRVGRINNAIGSKSDALAAYRKALQIEERLLQANPAEPKHWYAAAKIHGNIGLIEFFDLGRHADGLRSCQEAVRICEKLDRENPGQARFQAPLAEEYNHLGLMHGKLEQNTIALRLLQQARTIREKLVQDRPDRPEYLNALARNYQNIGNIHYSKTGQPLEALRAFQHARELYSKLIPKHPGVLRYQLALAHTLNSSGVLLNGMGRRAEALDLYKKSREILEKLTRENPAVTEYQLTLGICCNSIGNLMLDMDDLTEALRCFVQARDLFDKLVMAHPNSTEFLSVLATAHNNVGYIQSTSSKPTDALRSYQQAIAIAEKLVQQDRKIASFRSSLAFSYDNLGDLQRETGQPAEALRSHEKARGFQEEIVRENPDNLNYRSDLGKTFGNLGLTLRALGRRREAAAAFQSGADCALLAVGHAPQVVRYRVTLSTNYYNLALVQRELGRLADAAATTLARKQLWPGNFKELYAAAGELAQTAAAVGKGKATLSAEEKAERATYADQAVAALREAVAAGFDNFRHMENNPELEAIRGRPGYAELLKVRKE